MRLERENGLPRIVVRRFADGDEHAIAFDEEAYALGISPGYEYDTDDLRFSYSSMTTPAQVFDYDMDTRRARAAQDAGNSVRPRSVALCDAPDAWRRPRTARPCRCPCFTARTPRSTARRRSCSTAMALTA